MRCRHKASQFTQYDHDHLAQSLRFLLGAVPLALNIVPRVGLGVVAVHDLVELGLHLALEPLVLVVDRVAEVLVPVVGANLGWDSMPLTTLLVQRSGFTTELYGGLHDLASKPEKRHLSLSLFFKVLTFLLSGKGCCCIILPGPKSRWRSRLRCRSGTRSRGTCCRGGCR